MAAWLLFLIPLFLNRGSQPVTDDLATDEQPFSASVTIVRRGEPLDTAENGAAIVSTPLNRRAALRELAELDRAAARRRRRVLAFLLLVASVVAVFAGLGFVSWLTLAAPLGLAALFLVVARFSVRAMRRDLDARAAAIRGLDAHEVTVAIPILEEATDAHEQSVSLDAPVEMTGSLWDPIPIVKATYVQTPLAPRTVRTIDLTAPVPRVTIPVTADALESAEEQGEQDADERAAG